MVGFLLLGSHIEKRKEKHRASSGLAASWTDGYLGTMYSSANYPPPAPKIGRTGVTREKSLNTYTDLVRPDGNTLHLQTLLNAVAHIRVIKHPDNALDSALEKTR